MAAFEVPIATGLFTGIPHDIATAPGAMLPGQAIGNLADAYWSGQNQAYQQRLRDLFKNGVPANLGDIATQYVQAAGGAGIPEYVALRNRQAADEEAARPLPDVGTGPYSGYTPGPQATSPAASTATAPAGPAPAQGPTLRQVAEYNKLDPAALAREMQMSPDDTVDMEAQREVLTDAARKVAGAARGPQTAAAGETTTVPAATATATIANRFPSTTSPLGTPFPPSVGAPNPARPQSPPAQVAQAPTQAQASPIQAPADPQALLLKRTADAYAQRAAAARQRQTNLARDQDAVGAKAAGEDAAVWETRANDIYKNLLDRSKPPTASIEARDPTIAAAARTAEINKLRDVQAEKVYGGIRAAATQYERDLKPYTDLGTAILSDPRTYTGIGANAVLDINKVRANFGDAKAAMMQEAVQKLNAASVLSQINTQKDQMQEAGSNSSRLFSSQVEQVEKASANMGNTIQGNRFLLNVQQHMGEMSVEVARLAREYRAKHGTLDDGFDAQVSNYLQKHPVFSDLERALPDILGAPTVPPGAKDWTREQAAQWGREHGLKPGESARVSNGVYLTIPDIKAK